MIYKIKMCSKIINIDIDSHLTFGDLSNRIYNKFSIHSFHQKIYVNNKFIKDKNILLSSIITKTSKINIVLNLL